MYMCLLFYHVGHSRTIVGLEQSCRDQSKMFLLLLDPLKQKKFMLKIFTQSCGTTIQRNMRRSIPQETREQYEIVFVDGLLSKEEKKVNKQIVVILPTCCAFWITGSKNCQGVSEI